MDKPPLDLLIVVPARGGSKRLPGKNLRRLGDRSLLAHTASAIVESGLSAPVLLTTDNDAIAGEGERLGWSVPFRRPAALARDASPTIDAILHALDAWAEHAAAPEPEAVLVLQPTSPLRGGGCLLTAIELLSDRPDIDSVVAMTESHIPASRLYLADAQGRGSPVAPDTRRPVYHPNGALYLTRLPALRRDRSLYAGTVFPLVLDRLRAVDIDTEADWRLAEAILAAGLVGDAVPGLPQPSVGGDIS